MTHSFKHMQRKTTLIFDCVPSAQDVQKDNNNQENNTLEDFCQQLNCTLSEGKPYYQWLKERGFSTIGRPLSPAEELALEEEKKGYEWQREGRLHSYFIQSTENIDDIKSSGGGESK